MQRNRRENSMSRNDAPEVYELDSIVDDPRFEGFSMEDSPSILGRESLDEDLYPDAVDDNVAVQCQSIQ